MPKTTDECAVTTPERAVTTSWWSGRQEADIEKIVKSKAGEKFLEEIEDIVTVRKPEDSSRSDEPSKPRR